MDFDGFWRQLSGELVDPSMFTTCRYGAPFEAEMAANDLVVFATPGSGCKRRIPKDQFQAMWNAMKGYPLGERCARARRHCHDTCHHTSYICALINHVVGDQDME